MKQVNPILIKFFHRSAVLKLPRKLREIYQFVESKEEHLEEISINEEQFMNLMIGRSPLKEAADQFSLELSAVKEIMDEAQDEIDRLIKAKCNHMKWIDYTNKMKNLDNSKRFYIFRS